MSLPPLEEALQQVPSFRSLMETVALDAVEGRHLLLLTGGHVGAPLLRVGLEAALAWRRGPTLRHIELADQVGGETPPSFLARMTGIEEEMLRPVNRPASSEAPSAVVYDVLWLEGLEVLPSPQATQWLDYFRLSVRYGPPSSHILALPLRSRRPPLEEMGSDTRLAVHGWWGRLSVLDARLVSRLCAAERVLSPESLWREAVLPHVASGDLGLMIRGWDVVLQPMEALVDELKQHGVAQGLRAAELREAVRRLGRQKVTREVGEAPPPPWNTLWEMGAAWCSLEYGPELTTAALAVLEDAAGVKNRLWRGQAALLLPQITRLRMAVCQVLTEKHGRNWPVRFGASLMDEEQRRRAEEDPLSTELGPLEIMLRRPELGGQRFQPLIALCRWARNQLAHDHLVSFSDFKSLWDMQERLDIS